jgi:hypothetical protein
MCATEQNANGGMGIIDLKMKDFIVGLGASAQERSEVMKQLGCKDREEAIRTSRGLACLTG